MNHSTMIAPIRFANGVLPQRGVPNEQLLNPEDPAIHAITDFTREFPVTVDPERQVDDALNDMIRLGVRALLVYKEPRILGLITSYDIQGERPIQFLQKSNYRHHREIRVADIMTPWDDLQAINWEDIQAARASDLLHILEDSGLTHVIVVEGNREKSSSTIRALVSRTRLARQIKGLRPAN